MQKIPALLSIALLLAGTSCNFDRNAGNINLRYTDNAHTYSLEADFQKSQTKQVEHYLSERIGAAGNVSLTNLQSDAIFTLEDQTTFYMKKYPGHLEIKMEKDDNSSASYRRIKVTCEGLKKVLTK